MYTAKTEETGTYDGAKSFKSKRRRFQKAIFWIPAIIGIGLCTLIVFGLIYGYLLKSADMRAGLKPPLLPTDVGDSTRHLNLNASKPEAASNAHVRSAEALPPPALPPAPITPHRLLLSTHNRIFWYHYKTQRVSRW